MISAPTDTKSREHYLFRMTVERGVVERRDVFHKLERFKCKRVVIHPTSLAVDISTQCDWCIKDRNMLQRPFFHDSILVYMRFEALKPSPRDLEAAFNSLFPFEFTFEWLQCKSPYRYLKESFCDRGLLYYNVDSKNIK